MNNLFSYILLFASGMTFINGDYLLSASLVVATILNDKELLFE